MFKKSKGLTNIFIMIKLYSYTICYRENTVVAQFCREYSVIKINKRIKNKYWPVPYAKITNNQTRGQEKTVTLLLTPGGLWGGEYFFKYFWGGSIFMAMRGVGAAKKGDKPSDLNSCLGLGEWPFGWKGRFVIGHYNQQPWLIHSYIYYFEDESKDGATRGERARAY